MPKHPYRMAALIGGGATAIAVAVVLALLAGQPAPPPAPEGSPTIDARPSPSPGPSVAVGSTTVEQEGVRLTLSLDHTRAEFGDRVWAEVVVENISSRAILYPNAGCGPAVPYIADTPAPRPPIGRTDWPGDKGLLKTIVLALGEWPFAFVPEFAVDLEGHWGCGGTGSYRALDPGDTLTTRWGWDTKDIGEMPPAGGTYIVEATFHTAIEPRGTARVALEVAAPARTYIGPGEAMDLLLANPTFATLLAEKNRPKWDEPSLKWEDERWRFVLHLRNPSGQLAATVDAVTGQVSGVGFIPE